jgi:Uma2 family endonuclease
VSPIDVVLDRERALVVQPDVLFVSRARAAIIRERVWGAPDVVVEVLSWSTARHDRTVKLEWYRRYGTREGWLVDPIARRVEVLNLEKSTDDNPHVYVEGDTVRSDVLCSLALQVSDLFEE